MVSQNTVAIKRGDTLENRIKSAIDDLGGINQLIPSGKKILIKPNLVLAKSFESGATTNPQVLDTVLEELKKTSPQEIIIGEGSSAFFATTEKAFRVSGIAQVAHKHKVKLVDFQKEQYVTVPIPQGKEISEVNIAKSVLEADVLINLPVLKLHSQTLVTLSLKNLKGCMPNKEKKRFHGLNLDQCIADLNLVVPSNLVILDASLCAFSWEGETNPVALDTVLVGCNPVAVDTVATSLLGYRPQEVKHLQLAASHSLGTTNKEELQILHEEILEDVELPDRKEKDRKYNIPGLQVMERGACTPCEGSLQVAMRRLEQTGASLSGTVFLGQLIEKDDLKDAKGEWIGIGECGNKIAGEENSIRGCPPDPLRIYEELKHKSQR